MPKEYRLPNNQNGRDVACRRLRNQPNRPAFLSASVSFLAVDLRQQRVAAPDDFFFQLEHVAKNFCGCVVVYLFRYYWLLEASRKAPVVSANLFNRYAVTVCALFPLRPFGEHIRNIVGVDWRAFVIEAEAVSSKIVEPNRFRRRSFLKDERGRCYPCVWLEYAARQADDGLQVAFSQQQFAQARSSVGRAEEHAVGHDDAGAPARCEVVNEPLEKEEFGRAGIQLVIEIGENAFVLHPSGKWRIRKDDIEPLAGVGAAEARGERVHHRNVRLL